MSEQKPFIVRTTREKLENEVEVIQNSMRVLNELLNGQVNAATMDGVHKLLNLLQYDLTEAQAKLEALRD